MKNVADLKSPGLSVLMARVQPVIETRFQIPFVAELALREKQIQQNYRPVIAVHKWFARRPGSLFRSLLLSEFCEKDIEESYFESQKLPNIRIADPFMGGGIPLLEANRIGCKVLGFDINPMAWWIVREEIEHLDLPAYLERAGALMTLLEAEVGSLYLTRCVVCAGKELLLDQNAGMFRVS